jgi:hypothetical protein
VAQPEFSEILSFQNGPAQFRRSFRGDHYVKNWIFSVCGIRSLVSRVSRVMLANRLADRCCSSHCTRLIFMFRGEIYENREKKNRELILPPLSDFFHLIACPCLLAASPHLRFPHWPFSLASSTALPVLAVQLGEV